MLLTRTPLMMTEVEVLRLLLEWRAKKIITCVALEKNTIKCIQEAKMNFMHNLIYQKQQKLENLRFFKLARQGSTRLAR